VSKAAQTAQKPARAEGQRRQSPAQGRDPGSDREADRAGQRRPQAPYIGARRRSRRDRAHAPRRV